MNIYSCCIVAWVTYLLLFFATVPVPPKGSTKPLRKTLDFLRRNPFITLAIILAYASAFPFLWGYSIDEIMGDRWILTKVWLFPLAVHTGLIIAIDRTRKYLTSAKKDMTVYLTAYVLKTIRKLAFYVAITYLSFIVLVSLLNWISTTTDSGFTALTLLHILGYWQGFYDYLHTAGSWFASMIFVFILLLAGLEIFGATPGYHRNFFNRAFWFFNSKGMLTTKKQFGKFLKTNSAVLLLLALLATGSGQAWPEMEKQVMQLKLVVFKSDADKLDAQWAKNMSKIQAAPLQDDEIAAIREYSRAVEVRLFHQINDKIIGVQEDYIKTSNQNENSNNGGNIGDLENNLIEVYNKAQDEAKPQSSFGMEVDQSLEKLIAAEPAQQRVNALTAMKNAILEYRRSFSSSVSTNDILSLIIDKGMESADGLISAKDAMSALLPAGLNADHFNEQMDHYTEGGLSRLFKQYLKLRAFSFLAVYQQTHSIKTAFDRSVKLNDFATENKMLFKTGAYADMEAYLKTTFKEFYVSHAYVNRIAQIINDDENTKSIDEESFKEKIQTQIEAEQVHVREKTYSVPREEEEPIKVRIK